MLDAAATGSPQLGPLSTGLPHAEVPLSTVVAGVGGSAQGSPQPAECGKRSRQHTAGGDEGPRGQRRELHGPCAAGDGRARFEEQRLAAAI